MAGGDNQSTGAVSCAWGEARDDIYQALIPPAASGFEVSVDPFSDFNPRIAILEDSSCGQPANACVDRSGPTACEAARFTRGPHFFGNAPFFVVASGNPNGNVTVRVRAY